jgi:hypothetical protein
MHTPAKINNSLNWLIGGAQGSGVDSAANIFSLHVLRRIICIGNREYYSNMENIVTLRLGPLRKRLGHM